MSTSVKAKMQRVQEAAASLGIKAHAASLATRVKQVREKFLRESNVLIPAPQAGAFGLENLNYTPTRNTSFSPADLDVTTLVADLKDLGLADRHVISTAESCLDLFDREANYSQHVMRDDYEIHGTHAPLSKIVGTTAASNLMRQTAEAGLEAFGDDINRLASDDRVTMDLMIMRSYENIMDKGLARVNDASPVVTIRVPSPEAYDWATTQQANSTAYSRSGASNSYRLRDLYRNPTPVNSNTKRIIPLAANDSRGTQWNNSWATGKIYYNTSADVLLLDLARDQNRYTYDRVDRTDLVADGGWVDSVIVSITNPNGGSPVTEHFVLNTKILDLSIFVPSPSNKASGQRQVILTGVLPIAVGTTQWNGTASTIAAALTDAKIQANVRINATLNIQNGILQASGSVTLELKQLSSGAAISNGTNTLFGTLTATLSAYSVELYYDEENQRKANLAVWVQYYEQQFVVPRSRIYFTEYALSQEIDENAIAATSSIMALGNGRRGLDIIVNALNDVAANLSTVAANPEIAQAAALDDMSYASALVKPTVLTTTLNFNTEDLNTMNESTRLVEMHGRFRARALSMLTMLYAKSLMLNQYPAGERPVIKMWVHSTIADIVIGILDYHPDLKDRAATATGADYSMTLPNGYRLDVIKSNFDCLQGRLYAVPVIESDMASVLSAASIRDCGTVSTNYTPTTNGSVVRRVATTTREIVFMSNKVGLCMNITGIQEQLGVPGYTPVSLNADYTDSIAA